MPRRLDPTGNVYFGLWLPDGDRADDVEVGVLFLRETKDLGIT